MSRAPHVSLLSLGVLVVGSAASVSLTAPNGASAQPRCDAPQVLLLVDKSTSMTEAAADGTTKWPALVSAATQLAQNYHDRIDFGVAVFPTASRSCGGGRISLEVGANDEEAIVSALGSTPGQGQWTPLAQALEDVAEYAPIQDSSRRNHVIVMTDGWQWCYSTGNQERYAPVPEVEALRDLGITVHLVGFGTDVDASMMNRSAVAANTALPGCDATLSDPSADNQCYLQANDTADLEMIFDSIARSVTEEVCDGYDNDCDGQTDEGFDRDDDGSKACGENPDCNDEEPWAHPGATERCDTIDNDCDGTTDTGCSCTDGQTRACGESVGACEEGTQTCEGGQWGSCENAAGPLAEECDAVDNNCDGETDEDVDCGVGRGCIEGECRDLTDDEPTVTDAGVSDDAGLLDDKDRVLPPSDGGCSCDVPGHSATAPLSSFALALGLAAMVLRRTRRF